MSLNVDLIGHKKLTPAVLARCLHHVQKSVLGLDLIETIVFRKDVAIDLELKSGVSRTIAWPRR